MASSQRIEIDGVVLGAGCPPYVVAELSANHNGNLERALETIRVAKQMGASAIKLQTYTPDTMTIDCDKEEFRIRGGLWDGYNLYQLYQKAQTPFEWHEALFQEARRAGITAFSTPFDESAVDLLEELGAPAYKIASFEMIDLPLIRRVAGTGKPLIISTGMADLQEITEALGCAREAGCEELVLLHCVSSYPAPVTQSNLKTMVDLAQRFGVLTGLSDHTTGTAVSVAGVALGACFIEKHFTLNRADEGPDSAFSIEPDELRRLCVDAEAAWSALGVAGYERKPDEEPNSRFRRSLYVVADIAKGEYFTAQNVRRIRPGFGLPPRYFDTVVGRKACCDITRGTALNWDMIDD